MQISATIINYNDSVYLPEQLNSILMQIEPPDELCFRDDGSTDDSYDIAEMYIKEFEEVGVDLFVCGEGKNKGICYTANKAAEWSSNPLFYGGCSTDLLLPEFFQKQRKAFELYPQAGLAFSDPFHFSDEGWENPNSFNFQEEYRFYSPTEMVDLLKTNVFISGFTTVYKTELWKKYGGLIPSLQHHSDWWLNLCIVARHGAVAIKGPIAKTRWRASGYAEKGVKNPEIQTSVLDEIARLSKIEIDVRDFILKTNSWRWLGNGPYLKDKLKC